MIHVAATTAQRASFAKSSELLSRSAGFLRRKGGVSDRHGRSAGATQRFNLGVELFSERVDDAGAKPSFWLGKDAVRRANSVVGDRELPIRSQTHRT